MIQISQVYANDSNSLKFIERIYTESFPPDERRDFSDVIRLLEENDDFFIVLLSDRTLRRRQQLQRIGLWGDCHDRIAKTH